MHASLSALLSLTGLIILQTSMGQEDSDKNTCYSLNGGTHGLNDKWDDGVFWRQCIQQDGYAYPKLMGCVTPEGKFANSGEEFKKDGFLYSCILQPDGWVKYKVVGCITQDGQTIRAGGSYIYGTGEITFRRGCLEKEGGGVEQPILACKYSGPKITTEIKIGCYATVEDGLYFACWRPGSSTTGTVQTSFTSKLSDLSNLKTGGDCVA